MTTFETETLEPCIDDELLDSQTVQPDRDAASEAGLDVDSGVIPDFNEAIFESGYPDRGTEDYEEIARLYQYGYDYKGRVDIVHPRWFVESLPEYEPEYYESYQASHPGLVIDDGLGF